LPSLCRLDGVSFSFDDFILNSLAEVDKVGIIASYSD